MNTLSSQIQDSQSGYEMHNQTTDKTRTAFTQTILSVVPSSLNCSHRQSSPLFSETILSFGHTTNSLNSEHSGMSTTTLLIRVPPPTQHKYLQAWLSAPVITKVHMSLWRHSCQSLPQLDLDLFATVHAHQQHLPQQVHL